MTNIKVALRTVLNPDLPRSVPKCRSGASDKSFFWGQDTKPQIFFWGECAANSGLVQGP